MLSQTFDGQGNLLSEVEVPNPPRLISRSELFARFTPAEVVTICQSTHPGVIYVRNQLYTSDLSIDLGSENLISALNVLVSAGILNVERTTEILS